MHNAPPLRRGGRLLHLATWCGIAGSFIASMFAASAGNVGLLAGSILLSGAISLAPEIIAWWQTRRSDAGNDHAVSPVIGPEVWRSLGIDHEPASRPVLDWHDSHPDDSEYTIH